MSRPSAHFEILGRGTQQHARPSDAPCDKARCVELRGDAQGDVETFMNNVSRTVVELQIEVDLRICLEEAANPRRNMEQAKRHRRGNSQATPRHGLRIGYRILRGTRRSQG